MNCPLCGSKSELAFKADGYRLLDCTVCSHRFADLEADEDHVADVYKDAYFNDGGAGYSDYTQESGLLRKHGQMYAKIIGRFSGKTGRVLDVGAAGGYILQGFTDEGWAGLGLEPNKTMVQIGREQLGLDMQQGTLEKFETTEKYDLISMIQVVAHFWEPKKAFENASNLLDKNGLLLIETWNRESMSAKLFGRHWHEYSPPSVLHWFSLRGLTQYLDGIGFQRIAKGRPPKKISGAHAKSLLQHRLGNNPLLNLIPEKINFPYPSEDLFWALYRKV